MIEFSEDCKVLENETLGRYVVAARKFKAGEVLLIEGPTLIIPMGNEKRCANCFKLTNNQCRKCHIFLLCYRCASHEDFECDFFARTKDIRSDFLTNNIGIYGSIKCLLLNENPKTKHTFEQLQHMESHQTERRGSDIWCANIKNIVQPILRSGIVSHLKRTKEPIEELIQRLCGLLDVNSFEIRAPDQGSLRAIYLKASLLSHQCVANTSIAIDDNHQLKIYTNCAVEEGDMFTYCYINPLLGTEERRNLLQIGKYFRCNCVRCVDPTELGSHMSSLICEKCVDEPIFYRGKKWVCGKCDFSITSKDVDVFVAMAKREIILARGDIEKCEALITKFSKVLHSNHYLIIDLKQNVAAILRSFLMNPTYRPGKLVLQRKTLLCEEILVVLRIIQPGISRLKAIALYEMFNSFAELNRLRFHKNEITKLELINFLKQGEVMLRDAIRMLLYEPVNTPEGKLTRNMLKELHDLQIDLKKLSK